MLMYDSDTYKAGKLTEFKVVLVKVKFESFIASIKENSVEATVAISSMITLSKVSEEETNPKRLPEASMFSIMVSIILVFELVEILKI